MEENKNELMELAEETTVEDVDYAEVEGGSGKVIGLVVAGLTGVVALGAVAYKKIKAKKDGEPKKKRKKLMWVEVEDDVEKTENEVAEGEVVEEDSEE